MNFKSVSGQNEVSGSESLWQDALELPLQLRIGLLFPPSFLLSIPLSFIKLSLYFVQRARHPYYYPRRLLNKKKVTAPIRGLHKPTGSHRKYHSGMAWKEGGREGGRSDSLRDAWEGRPVRVAPS